MIGQQIDSWNVIVRQYVEYSFSCKIEKNFDSALSYEFQLWSNHRNNHIMYIDKYKCINKNIVQRKTDGGDASADIH